MRRNGFRITKSVMWSAAVLLATLLAVSACDSALQSAASRNADSNTGSLRLAIGSVESMSLLPDIDMNPASYEIHGVGPGEQSFSVETGDSSVVVDDLRVGTWSITVNAQNNTNDRIGSGIGNVTVEAGAVQGLSISVRPLSGPGMLDLEVSWLEELVSAPEISARLIAHDRSERNISFTAHSGTSAEFTGDEIDAGYYTLALQLLDGDSAVAGAVQSVRIAEGARTHGSYNFTEINDIGGSIDIVITPELDDPLVLAINGASGSLPAGETMSVQAVTENAGGQEVFYTWYLNGTKAATGANAEIGAELSAGTHRLDLIAFTSDGRRSGSATHGFSVVAGDNADDGSGDDSGDPEPEYDFIDTFEAGTINTDVWTIGTWTEHGGRLSAERTYIENDMLVLAFEYDTAYYQETGLFKSSAIQSQRNDFRFGRWEARLKPTDVDGVLPTMYTIDWRDGGGQTRQEIDIEFVTVNISDDYSEVHLAVHGADYSSWNSQVELPFNPADDFHVWGFDITEERIQWFVDDIVLFEYWYDEQSGAIDAPYSLKFNFWSAHAENGGAGYWIQGPPVPDTELYYYIDWVRFISYE